MSPRAPSIFVGSAVPALGLLLATTATRDPLSVTDPDEHELRVLRWGRFALEATAADAPSALAPARLALERFDR